MKAISFLFFYLLILFLPTQLGRHFWPDFAFVSGARVDYLSPTLYFTDILIFILVISLIFSKNKFSIFNFQILLVATFILIGIVFSKNPLAGFYGLLKLVEFLFVGFFIASNINKLKPQKVLLLFAIGITFESLLSFAQYLNQSSIGGIFYWLGERQFSSQTPGIANASISGALILRTYGTFSHPNVLAGYLTIAMAMVISNLKSQISNIIKVVFMIALVFGTAALFLTMSRVAIVLWVIILALWLMKFSIFNFQFKMKSKKLNFKNLLNENSMKISNFKLKILFLGFVITILLLSPLRFRFADIKLTDESIVARQELIKSSFLMIKENPFFGVGLNNFLIELPSYKKINNYFLDLQPVHNIYLLILSQTGIVGFGLFTWFMFKTFKNFKLKNSLKISNFKFQILLMLLILGLFDHYFLTLQQGQLLFSFILGLCWAKLPKRK